MTNLRCEPVLDLPRARNATLLLSLPAGRPRHGSLTTLAEVKRLFLPPHRPDHSGRISSSGSDQDPATDRARVAASASEREAPSASISARRSAPRAWAATARTRSRSAALPWPTPVLPPARSRAASTAPSSRAACSGRSSGAGERGGGPGQQRQVPPPDLGVAVFPRDAQPLGSVCDAAADLAAVQLGRGQDDERNRHALRIPCRAKLTDHAVQGPGESPAVAPGNVPGLAAPDRRRQAAAACAGRRLGSFPVQPGRLGQVAPGPRDVGLAVQRQGQAVVVTELPGELEHVVAFPDAYRGQLLNPTAGPRVGQRLRRGP